MQFFSQALFLIPMLLVGFLGIVMFFSLPVPTRVRALGVGGLLLIMCTSLGNVLFYTWYSQAIASGNGGQSMAMMSAVRLVATTLNAAGLALLVSSAIAGRGLKTPF
jgi:hypothetical protein